MNKFSIKIDNEIYHLEKSALTGKEILGLAGKITFSKWLLNLRLKGGAVKKIGYDEVVDLTNPGIEKFLTLPIDQIDGDHHDSIIDIEEYLKENKAIPHGARYLVKIDRDKFVVDKQKITGKELLELACRTPFSKWLLNLRIKGGSIKKIGYEEVVDLAAPGIEKFLTLPLDQTEGELRRQFSLPEEDIEYLDTLGLFWETITEGDSKWLLIHDFLIPEGYNHSKSRVAIKIENGYPVAQLDMVYFYPSLAKGDNSVINALSNHSLEGLNYQRWSRHRTGMNPWRPGIDDISSHLSLIQYWLERELNTYRHAV